MCLFGPPHDASGEGLCSQGSLKEVKPIEFHPAILRQSQDLDTAKPLGIQKFLKQLSKCLWLWVQDQQLPQV